jgi:single-strand DNA-binding protein
MPGLNKVQLIGYLGADPEVKRTQDGRLFCNMRVATSEQWKDKQTGERKEKVHWHRVVCYNENLTKIVQQFLAKGSQVYLEGQLETRSYDKDGTTVYATEVVMRFNAQLVMLGGKGKASGDDRYTGDDNAGGKPGFNDDIPFGPEWRA